MHFPSRAEPANTPVCICHPQTALISILIFHLQSSPGQASRQRCERDAGAGDVSSTAHQQDVTLAKKMRAAKELAQEQHEEGKWQQGLCYTQHFLKMVSAKALNQGQDVKSPGAARSPGSPELPDTRLQAAGVQRPPPESQSCKHSWRDWNRSC